MPSTPSESCTVIAVITDSGWQPMLASVRRSACMPAPPEGSDAAKVSTSGGNPGSVSGMGEGRLPVQVRGSGGKSRERYNGEFTQASASLPMKKYMCLICGWIYDEETGAPEEGIAAGHALGGRAAELDVPRMRRAQGRLRDDRAMKILHTMLRVGDLPRSIDFYTTCSA